MAKRLLMSPWALGLVFLFLSSFSAFGQGSESFSNITTGQSSYATRTWTGDNGLTWTSTQTRTDQTITGAAVCFQNSGTPTLSVSGITGGVGNLTFKHQQKFTGSGGVLTLRINGNVIGTVNVTTSVQTATFNNINVSGTFDLSISGNSSVRPAIDDISWTGYAASTPTLGVSPSSIAFGNVTTSTTSSQQFFTLTSSNLTGNVTVTPPTGFEISTTSGGPYSASAISLTPAQAASVAVYVVFKPTTATAYSGNITVSSSGATTQNVAVTGTGVAPCTAPANQATSLNLTPAATTIDGSFTAASGGASGYLVLVSTSATAPTNPTNGSSYTTIGGAYNGNTAIAANTTGTTFTASGLTPTTPYYFYIYAYNNTGCSGGPVYKTSALTGTATTLNAPIAIATYTFTGADGDETTYPADLPHTTGITPSVMSRAGNSGEVASDQFNASGWSTSSSVALGDYYQFSVTTAPGTTMDLVDLLIDMQRSSSGPQDYQVRTSIDNYTAVAGSGSIPTAVTTRTIDLSGTAYQGVSGTVTIRIYGYDSGGGAGTFRIDNVILNGFVNSGPTIITSVSSLTFADQTVNTTSTVQNYTVEGFNLTSNIVINPPAGYEISLSSGSGFGTTNITLTQSGGNVATTTIYVRFAPTATTAYNGNIEHTSTGAIQADVALTGTGIPVCTTPLNQATNFTASVSGITINGGFTASVGGADGYLVVRSTSSTLSFGPTDGVSYTLGNSIGGGTVVGNNASTTFTTTGAATTQYYFFIYAFNNTNCGGGPAYKKPYLAGTATTLTSPFVLFDNFDRTSSTTVGIPSSGGAVAWSEVEASAGLAEIYNNRLDINNTSPQGKAYTVFDMTGRYSTNFDQATGELEWYFNMAQSRPDPSGFGTSNYGVAMVLGATSSSYSTAGNGYAVVLGEGGSNDRVKLVKFTGGLTAGTMTDLVADGPNTGGISGDNMFDVHVKYNPGTHTWTLYVNDGGYDPSVTFNFADPTAVTYGSGATVVDQTYTGSNLPYAGGLWSYATSSGEFASFDNFSIPTAQPCQNTWTGAVSTDWFNAANWSCGTVPVSTSDVVIPNTGSTTNRYPVIASSIGQTAATNHLTLNAGASVTINATVVAGFPVSTNDLEVYGNLTNNGNANWGTGTVTFKGSSSQTISGNNNFQYLTTENNVSLASGIQKVYGTLALKAGTLTTNGRLTIGSNATYTGLIDEFTSGYTGGISGNITVERYSNNTASQFFYIGSPVGGAQVSDWGGDFSLATMNGATNGSQVQPTTTCSITELQPGSPYGGLFDFRENTVTFCNLEGWHVRTSGSIPAAQGFLGRMNAGTTINLTGSFVTGSVTSPTLTKTTSSAPSPSGMNLLANPYAAPIEWLDVAAANNGSVLGTAYFYQTSGPLAGTYVPVNSTNGGGEIGTSQSFFVEAVSNGVTVNFANSMKRNGENTYLRATPAYEQMLTLDVAGNGFADRTMVAFGRDFTTAFDSDYDARKLMSKPGQPSMYVNDGSLKYSIYAQPSIDVVQVVPIDFAAGTNGNFTISADISTFDPTAMVYLEDRLTGTMTNLRMVGSYSFSATTADAVGRFALHFYPAMEVLAADASCAGTDGAITFNQPGTTEWKLDLVDANGSNVYAANSFNGSHTVSNLPLGNYTLTLVHASGYTVSQNYVVTGPAPVAASFSAPILATEGDDVVFTNLATNATTYTWNFGDGSTSTDANPVHNYTAAGVYVVEMVATNGACQESFSQTITVQVKVVNGVSEALEGKVKIYAYGTDLNIVLSNLENISTVYVFDLTGRMVIAPTTLEQVNGNFVIGLENVANGYFFVRLNNEKDTFIKKVFVNSGK